ncbi:MAG: hypothetical protein QG635_1714, partial [Bacteroidota bacterium]|nr:hypothetical protein [Bacteroidota bacterium]
HNDIELETVRLAKGALDESKSPLVQYLVGYLLQDENKHLSLLDTMSKIKAGMYPYGGF